MRTLIRLLALTVIMSVCSGCMSLMFPEGDMAMKGRYGELEKLVSPRVNNFSTANNYDLYHLCLAYYNLKKYNRLFPCLDEADIRANNKNFVVMLSNMSAGPTFLRASAYVELGNYTKAIEEAEKSHKINKAIKDLSERAYDIQILGVLSLAHALNGNREAALKYTEMLDDISTMYPYVLLKSDKMIGLARAYMALGDYQKSADYMQQHDNSFWRVYTNLAAVATGLVLPDEDMHAFQQLPKFFMVAKTLFETGKHAEAKTIYDDLLNKPQMKDNGEIYWMILYDRGRIAEKEGNLKDAIDFYKRAIDIIEEQRSTINTEASKIGFVGNKQAVYHGLITALFASNQFDKAFEYVERAKSRALVDLLSNKKDFSVKSGKEDEIRRLLAQKNSIEEEAMVEDPAIDKNKTRSVQIAATNELKSKEPELASLVSVSYQPTTELQAVIPKDETLIEYYYFNNDMFAFMLSSSGLKAFKLNSNGLADDIHQLRTTIEDPHSTDYIEISRKLYRKLIGPFAGDITTKNLIIVPHAALHYLPFNALHDGENHIIDRFTIRMLPSASVMKYLQTAKLSKQGDILAFGNPDLGNPQYDLLNAQNEAVAVAQTRQNSKVFLRKEATETAFTRYGHQFNLIHFATHGKFNADAPLKSAIMLAKDAENDGMLTVEKLYSTRIDSDLVTLSACETGLGKISNGDDIVGLTRGFLYAGSRSIVASLWKVDDRATSLLMGQFYSDLNLLDKRDALRNAQLTIKRKYPHPFFWAAFQLTGNAI